MKNENSISQILGIVDTGLVYELQVTGESGGDRSKGIPTTKTVFKHRLVSSHIIKRVREEWITTGIAEAGDVTLVAAVELTLTNQVEHQGVKYDIIKKVDGATYSGTYYLYILRRVLV